MVLLGLEGIDTPEQAVTLRGKILWFDRADAPPEDDGEYYVFYIPKVYNNKNINMVFIGGVVGEGDF